MSSFVIMRYGSRPINLLYETVSVRRGKALLTLSFRFDSIENVMGLQLEKLFSVKMSMAYFH